MLYEELATDLYRWFNVVNQMLTDPMMRLSRGSSIPILSVFLIGILASTAPCQITTNLGAIGFITKDPGRKKALINTGWYVLGKLMVYMIYGILIILFNIRVEQSSIPLFSIIRKSMGPMVVVIGLYLLGVINLRGSIGQSLIKKAEKVTQKYNKIPSSLIIGIVFSLAFCPTLFWLFFGMVIPMSIGDTFGVFYPVIFAAGSLVPIMIWSAMIVINKGSIQGEIKYLRKLHGVMRKLGGTLLIIIGILDSMIYWMD